MFPGDKNQHADDSRWSNQAWEVIRGSQKPTSERMNKPL
jgi:hypothetical protein